MTVVCSLAEGDVRSHGGDMAPRREACLPPRERIPSGTKTDGWRRRVISRHGDSSPATTVDLCRRCEAATSPMGNVADRHVADREVVDQ